MKNLVSCLAKIKDPRKAKGIRHDQTTTLVIMIMAIMCDHTGLNAMARFAKSHREDLAEVMPLPRGKSPSSATIKRLSKAINFDQICKAFNKWMIQYFKEENIAIDGKSINSTVSSCHDSKQNFVSLVSFFGQNSNLVWHVGKLENGKSSEITKVQDIIKKLDIKQSVFTLDALHCQKKTVKIIIESDNDYIITAKRNQPKLHDSIKEKTKTQPEDAFSWKQKGHGHPVSCRIKIWKAPSSMTKQWTGLSKVISVTRKGVRNGKKFSGETYYITSLKTSAYRLSKAIRGHHRE
jgi:predicted transposase YbfD/YdcC